MIRETAEVLEQLSCLTNPENLMRFKKETLHVSHKMCSKLSEKERLPSLSREVAKASFLRRKKLQGKVQFDLSDDRGG